MAKRVLTQPTLILLYGYPGAGKTYVARQLSDELGAAHVQDDRIRHELFEEPRYDKQENDIVQHLMEYMTSEFLRSGVSVIYDTNAMRVSQRRILRDLARKAKAKPVLIWLQIDLDSAFLRVASRDRRKADDRYTVPMDRTTFERVTEYMQNPTPTEDYMVLSGKHTFRTQSHMIMKKLFDLNLLHPTVVSDKIIKPELVNIVPNPQAGRVDITRRNITIR